MVHISIPTEMRFVDLPLAYKHQTELQLDVLIAPIAIVNREEVHAHTMVVCLHGYNLIRRTKMTPKKAPLIGSFLFVDTSTGFNLRPAK